MTETTSVCPMCRRDIPAEIFDRDGAVFMRKRCSEHGDFEVKIAGHSWYYNGLNEFYTALFPQPSGARKCLFNVLFLTSDCNLNCPICFTDANQTRKIPNMPLSVIHEYLNHIRNEGRVIRLSGGEPTLRGDLPEIIKAITQSGNHAYMFTNGLRLNDRSYLQLLKRQGLRGVIMWLDSLDDDSVHELTRGRPVLKEKKEALSLVRDSGIPFCLYHVKVKGVNDSDMPNVWEYARKNGFVKSLWVKSYAHLGKKGFSRGNEFLMDELIETVAAASGGAFTLEDMYYYQKLNYILAALEGSPFCCYSQTMIVPRRPGARMEFSRYAALIDEFPRIWQDSRTRAQMFFRAHLLKELCNSFSLPLLGFLFRLKMSGLPMYRAVHEFLPRGYLFLIVNSFYDAWNYDKMLVHRQCINGVFHLDPSANVPLCELNVKSFG